MKVCRGPMRLAPYAPWIYTKTDKTYLSCLSENEASQKSP